MRKSRGLGMSMQGGAGRHAQGVCAYDGGAFSSEETSS